MLGHARLSLIDLALDRKPTRQERADFAASRKAETQFAITLRKIVSHIEAIVGATYDPSNMDSTWAIQHWADRYAETLEPWATAVTARMHRDVSGRDARQWDAYSRDLGAALREEIAAAPIGEALRRIMGEQVTLIKSLPIEAAERVHDWTIEGLSEGYRHEDLIDKVRKIGGVTRARATLIARTETARTASVLTQTRAQYIGSTHYRWRSARDANVRPTHADLDKRSRGGETFAWANPPECDKGHHAHPGQIFNCRCWAEPVLPD